MADFLEMSSAGGFRPEAHCCLAVCSLGIGSRVYDSRCCARGCAQVCVLGIGSRVYDERWGAGVETQKNVRGEIGGWGRVPFNETYAPSLSTIYDGA